MREELNEALSGRYRLVDELGAGGMATVFRAEDLRHDRFVAIKVLVPQLAESIGTERFLSEIKTTAGLSHPHILALHDSGVEAGHFFYVMPMVEGDSLRDHLDREGPLSIDEAVKITLEVADALAYAHGRGVIHRDVKPENVLLLGNHAVVADFGIASVASGDDALAMEGLGIGTPTYMSPEQAAGDVGVDGRADLYALGCMLYEMLAGEPPFTARSAESLVAKKMTLQAPVVTEKRAEVPAALQAVISRALKRDPAERFASLEAFSEALRALEQEPEEQDRSIAVLAFDNMSEDPDTEYFSDGISEDIILALTKIPSVRVAARTSAFSFKGRNVDLRTIGAELGVAHVLEGSVRRAGNRLRVTAQLVDVEDGLHLWSERFDREMTDVFAIQDEISSAIAEKLKLTLAPENWDQAPEPSIAAYELFLKGRAAEYKRGPGIVEAVELYKQAIAVDPDFGAAHAALAHGLALMGFYGFLPTAAIAPLATEAAAKALEKAPMLGQAHRAAALVALMVEHDREKAGAAWQRAISLASSDPSVRFEHAFFHLCGVEADFARAETEVRQALLQDPLSALANAYHALVLAFNDRHEETVAAARRALELDPTSFFGRYQLGLGLIRMGRPDEAIASVEPVLAPSGRHPWILLVVGLAHGAAGRREEALAIYHELANRAKADFVQPMLLLLLAHGLGLQEESARLITLGGRERDMTFPVLLLHYNDLRGAAEMPEALEVLRDMGWHDEVERRS